MYLSVFKKRDIKFLRSDDISDCGIQNRYYQIELPNESNFESLESFKFKILLSIFQMLFIKLNLSLMKRYKEGGSEGIISTFANRI